MPKRNNPQRITLPKRNISTSPDGWLAASMGNNPPSVGNTPGILPGLAALAAAQQQMSRSVPQRTVNSLGLTSYGNPFAQYEYKPKTPYPGVISPNFQVPKDTYSLISESTPENRVQALGKIYTDYSSNINVRIGQFNQSLIDGGARPPVLTTADAIRLMPGLSVDDVKSAFADLGYEFVPTSQGGILRNTGGTSTDGSTPIGNSPGAGYTWSGGAWHAPAGEDPYSDIKSVYMSKNRGFVTPEVANLLRRQRRRRMSINAQRRQEQAATAPSSQNTTAEGLVTLRASFG